jgi:hypothetical protein
VHTERSNRNPRYNKKKPKSPQIGADLAGRGAVEVESVVVEVDAVAVEVPAVAVEVAGSVQIAAQAAPVGEGGARCRRRPPPVVGGGGGGCRRRPPGLEGEDLAAAVAVGGGRRRGIWRGEPPPARGVEGRGGAGEARVSWLVALFILISPGTAG